MIYHCAYTINCFMHIDYVNQAHVHVHTFTLYRLHVMSGYQSLKEM